MTVCLTIAGFLGALYCQAEAQPPTGAECWKKSPALICHVSDPHSLPAFVSFYVPSWGGVNADDDPAHTADMTPVDQCWSCAACPAELYGRWLELEGVGRFQCRDTGGAIVPTYGRKYTAAGFRWGWYLIIDVLSIDGQPPPLAWHLVEWNFADPID